MRERGIEKETVQKICRICRDEREVRVVLDMLWKDSLNVQEGLNDIVMRNEELYEFEKLLIQK